LTNIRKELIPINDDANIEILNLNSASIQSQNENKNTLIIQQQATSSTKNNEIQQEASTNISDLLIEQLQYEEDSASNNVDPEEYNENLIRETNKMIKEKQNYDRLSHSVERYVVEDAKVVFFLQIFT
jgi:hypothetical protein